MTLIPILPHYANECLEILKTKEQYIKWPNFNEKLIIDDEITFVIQINGKKRGLIACKKDTGKEELIKKILEEKNINKYLEDKKIIKEIFVPNKLMNILI